jgi:hypothetical protein
MSEKPKRPWFRFHLLTLVLMASAAGGFMWVNIRMHHTAAWERYALDGVAYVGPVTSDALYEYGWPVTVYGKGIPTFCTPKVHWKYPDRHCDDDHGSKYRRRNFRNRPPPPRGSQAMTEKPKRPWFRFHLLTLVLVTCCGGMCGYLNFGRALGATGEPEFFQHYDPDLRVARYGWPMCVAIRFVYLGNSDDLRLEDNGHTVHFHVSSQTGVGVASRRAEHYPNRSCWPSVAIDAACAIGLLLAVAFVSEWLISRRETRKP